MSDGLPLTHDAVRPGMAKMVVPMVQAQRKGCYLACGKFKDTKIQQLARYRVRVSMHYQRFA